MNYNFNERLEFSMGAKKSSDMETIRSLLDGCDSVRPHEGQGDDNGIDYIATLRRGAIVNIDVKTREAGCSRYWRNNQPELAIEIWSVMPDGIFATPRHKAKAGWTIDEKKSTDLVLYTFDASDTNLAFLLPFQSLRMAARRMINKWMKEFKVDVQRSNRGQLQWQSQAVFVPAQIVINAIDQTFVGLTATDDLDLQMPLCL